MPSLERGFSPLGKFIQRTKERIMLYQWRAKLAETRARAEACAKKKPPRQGRSRRRSASVQQPSKSPALTARREQK